MLNVVSKRGWEMTDWKPEVGLGKENGLETGRDLMPEMQCGTGGGVERGDPEVD